MAPVSYRGPLESDVKDTRTHSQTDAWSDSAKGPGITVGDVLSHKGDEIYSVTRHDSVRDAVATLTRLRIGALVVVDPENRPIGIVTERDVVTRLDGMGPAVLDATVEAIMTPDPVAAFPEQTIETVAHTMTERGFRHMPVMKDGALCGVISIRDVVRHRLQEVEYENLKIKQAMVG